MYPGEKSGIDIYNGLLLDAETLFVFQVFCFSK